MSDWIVTIAFAGWTAACVLLILWCSERAEAKRWKDALYRSDDAADEKDRLEEMVRAVVSGNLEFLGQAVFEGALGPVANLESVTMHQTKKLLAAIDAEGGET